MNEAEQSELRSLEIVRERYAKALTKAGKEDGAEIAYAESYKAIVDFHRSCGDGGVMGIKRDKHRIGVS